MATAGNLRYQFRFAHEPNLIDYEGQISMTSATIATVTGIKGVASCVNTATGAFTITLNRKGYYLRDFRATHYASTGALLSIIPAELPATAHADAQAGSVKFLCKLASNGAATNPTATDVLWVRFTISNSVAGAR